MNKRVAVIGSSGGNLYNLGGRSPKKLLGEIITQLRAAKINIESISFVAANESLDYADSKTKAKLYVYENDELKVLNEGTLDEVNVFAKEQDLILANKINDSKVDGLIIISADPKGTNKESFKAAAEMDLPAVGTGGTSVSNARAEGLRVISASGTTGSTNRTRAVSYVGALAKNWEMKYKPIIGSYDSKEEVEENIFKRISFRGVMVTSLPAFVAMALTIALSRIPQLSVFEDVFGVMIATLPIVISTIAAKNISGYDDIGIVSGIIAGALAAEGGILGGMIAGILAGLLVSYLVEFSVKRNFPATTVNILAGGVSGLLVGLVMYFGFSSVTMLAARGIQSLIEISLSYNAILAGAVAGLLIWPAIIAGVYHAAILPIMLLEMEQYGHSFLGAIDAAGLGAVAIGITLAVVVFPREKGDRVAAGSGLFVLTAFGTFVEAAYPYMFANKLIFGGALASASIAGAVAGLFNVRAMGYVPLFVQPFISNNAIGFILALLAGLIPAFLITSYAMKTSKGEKKEI